MEAGRRDHASARVRVCLLSTVAEASPPRLCAAPEKQSRRNSRRHAHSGRIDAPAAFTHESDERRPTARWARSPGSSVAISTPRPDEPRFAREKTVPALLADGFSWAWTGNPLLFPRHRAAQRALSRRLFRPHLLSRRDSIQSLGRKHLAAIERPSRRERRVRWSDRP